MQGILLASAAHYFFAFLLFIIAVFLVGLILLQRGRGGGLTGALGGAGGQSAFGSKTGDVFTKITIVAATVWILACLTAVKVLTNPTSSVFASGDAGPTVEGSDKKSGQESDSLGSDKSADATGAADSSGTPDAEKTPAESAEKPEADAKEPASGSSDASEKPSDEKPDAAAEGAKPQP